MLKVKPCEVIEKGTKFRGFGITDGKKWFIYAYTTKEKAEALLPSFDFPGRVGVNIAFSAPLLVYRG